DDNEQIADILSEAFTDEDLPIEVATNGHEAIDLIMSHSFDIVVTDINLPGINGIEIYNEVSSKLPNAPEFFFITGELKYRNSSFAQTNRVFFKPLNIPQLVRTVTTILSQQQ